MRRWIPLVLVLLAPLQVLAQAWPDKPVKLVATTAHAINQSLFKTLNYGVQRDFTSVSLLTQVPLMFDTMPSAMQHVKSGRLRALGITGAQRSPAAPDLPTVAESGLPGYQAYAWNGLLAPAGTPPAVINRLSEELKTAPSQHAVQERFGAQGFAATWTSPAQAVTFVPSEVEKWGRTVQLSGAKVE